MAGLLPYRTGKRKASVKGFAGQVSLTWRRHNASYPLNGKPASRGWDGTMNDKTIPPKKAIRQKRAARTARTGWPSSCAPICMKRKAQARSRRTGEADERPEGLAAAEKMHKD